MVALAAVVVALRRVVGVAVPVVAVVQPVAAQPTMRMSYRVACQWSRRILIPLRRHRVQYRRGKLRFLLLNR